MWVLDHQPAGTHNLPLQDEQLERARIGTKYLEDIRAARGHRDDRFC